MAIEDLIQFYIPTRIYYQSDSLAKMSEVIKQWGSRAVIVSVRKEIPDLSVLYDIRSVLEKSLNSVILYDDVEEYPDSDDLDTASYYIRQTDAQIIIGLGGVDSLSMAKALAMMINNEGFCSEFLSNEREPIQNSLPCVTMPLYPSYGMEIVPSFILLDAEDQVKKLFRNDMLFPALTYIDPIFSLNLDSKLTSATGAAIIAASVETFLSKNSNDITNTLALRALEMVFRALPRALAEGATLAHRNSISIASLLTGMGYANGSLGTCLAIAMAINSLTGIAFDIIMGIVLPHIMEYNLTASPGKYVQIARILDRSELKDITVIEAAIKAVEGVRKLFSEINLPSRLSEIEIDKSIFPRAAQIASSYGFLKSTPRLLSTEEIETILLAAY
jgi:alcohol dehydrogenase class IV